MSEWFEGDVQANGIRIHYHRTGGKDKPVLLLLHGITDNGLCWSRVARSLEGSYDLVMPDARGHGKSDGIETGFSVETLADDAAAVIRELGLEKPYVFGHSMGAITTVVLAANYSDLIRAILLEDPPLMNRPPERTPEEAQSFEQAKKEALAFRALPRNERVDQGFVMNLGWVEEEILPWAEAKGEYQPEVYDKRLIFRSYPWREAISRIKCPVLLVTGDPEKGALVTPKIAQEAAGLCKSVEVQRISGTGHCIHRDHFDETLEAVRAFLKKN